MKHTSTDGLITEKNGELLRTQTNAEQKEDKQESGKLIDIEPIEGTPFTIVTIAEPETEEQSFIAIGDARLTEKMSYGKAKMLINEKNWDLILQVVLFVNHRMAKILAFGEEHEKEKAAEEGQKV